MVDELIYAAKLLPDDDLVFSAPEHSVLRQLAAQVSELAARPAEQEKRRLWRSLNTLNFARPLIFCFPENSWHEVIPEEQLECEGRIARQWELQLRQEIFWGTILQDDRVIEPNFFIEHIKPQYAAWGLEEERVGGEEGGSYTWKPALQSEDDLEKMHLPTQAVDFEATQTLLDTANDIFGDLLPARLRDWWWGVKGLTDTLIGLRGMEQLMYDLTDQPDFVHRIMALLRDGTLAFEDELVRKGLLQLNNEGAYVGSGGFGWTEELPAANHAGQVRLCDRWGFGESQETVGVSPGMFAKFVFPYQLPILERYGLACYGCCEPLDQRWKTISQVPNLRRVSVPPWSDREIMAAHLEDRYVFSMKPNPADLAGTYFNEERIRADLRRDLEVTRGCQVEVIMKDAHTVRGEPQRLIRWVQIVREEIELL